MLEQKESERKITLTGTVFDIFGSVIVDAEITAYQSDGAKFESRTLDDGIYTLSLLPNLYKIKISATGFCDAKIEDYQVVNYIYRKMSLDFVLQVPGSVGRKYYQRNQPKEKKNKSKKKEIIIEEK